MLLLAALAEGSTSIDNLLDSDDIRYMVAALQTLGLALEEDRGAKRLSLRGAAGRFPTEGADLFLGNVSVE